MAIISFDEFEKWLERYRVAWERGDPRAAINLFADDSRYYENPFADPMIGKEAIYKYWSEGAGESQKDVHFTHRVLAVVDTTGLAHWAATFVRLPSGNPVELDGMLMAEFDEHGKCILFREWWHRREEGAVDAS